MFGNCEELLKVSEECLDKFSMYEMDAYVSSMKAAYLREVQKWEEALQLILRAKIIYQKISSYKDSLEAVIYNERIGQLNTFVRQCQ